MSAVTAPHHDESRLASAPGRIPVWLLIGAFAAAPAAWITQLVVCYGVASHACFPETEPWLITPPPGWGGESGWLAALNLVCLTVAIAGGFVSWRLWRGARDERGGDAEAAREIALGRTRFIANCGVLTGAIFGIAILFGTLQPFLLASCWRIAQ